MDGSGGGQIGEVVGAGDQPPAVGEDAEIRGRIDKCINGHRADWIMNGFTDADWDSFVKELQAYKIDDYLAIYQKYFDAFNAA